MPFFARLAWTPSYKVAERAGRRVELHEAPNLGRGPVDMVDYVPCCTYCIRRHPQDGIEDMDRDEIDAANALLREAVPSRL
jgi:hypothetical protein